MAGQKDHWDAQDYQHSASYVPKLAGKIVEWLDLKSEDVLVDIGCGDGILNLDFAKFLAEGTGSVHGIDSSAKMIASARDLCKDYNNCTFEVLDGTKLASKPELQNQTFTKAFSNAAMHWILRSPSSHDTFFPSVYAALCPGGTFAFEMGGLGNVCEMRTALLMAAARHIGLPAAVEAHPWFFPDEAWAKEKMEAAGFRVDKVEREWRPTKADKGGVEGWVRLFGGLILEKVPEEHREDVVKEAAGVLEEVCRQPDGGYMISYVRLRGLGTKVDIA